MDASRRRRGLPIIVIFRRAESGCVPTNFRHATRIELKLDTSRFGPSWASFLFNTRYLLISFSLSATSPFPLAVEGGEISAFGLNWLYSAPDTQTPGK